MSNPVYTESIADMAKREARRQYQREWRRNNPDKGKAQRNRYWEKKGQEYLAALHTGEARV